MSKAYEVVVIGGGPAGYVAAIRAAQLGLKTACVDAWLNRDGNPALGGTCLNVGCIPSKALLESSEIYHRAEHEFAAHGVKIDKLGLDVGQMQKRKREITRSLTDGIAMLFRSNKIEWIQGHGCVLGTGKVRVTPVNDPEGEYSLECDDIIIASGSEPVSIDIAPFDGERIVDSQGALDFDEVPKRLGIIGAGYIGVELGSVWSRLGAETVLLEAQDDFLAIADRQIAKEALRQFRKQGMDIRLGARVLGTKVLKRGVRVEYSAGDEKKTETFDRLIVSVGRRACTEGLFSGDSGLELDDKGFVDVNDRFRTNLPRIYAVGDVIGGPMLAHKGSEEGAAVAEIIAGESGEVNYETVPSIVYTAPELAWVGRSEEQVKASGTEYRVGTFPFSANGRAKALEQAVGMVKIIADAKTDRILGVHMIGPYVSELIAEMVLAMEYGASSEDIARTMHAHPTLGESVHEAALSVAGRAIHALNRKK